MDKGKRKESTQDNLPEDLTPEEIESAVDIITNFAQTLLRRQGQPRSWGSIRLDILRAQLSDLDQARFFSLNNPNISDVVADERIEQLMESTGLAARLGLERRAGPSYSQDVETDTQESTSSTVPAQLTVDSETTANIEETPTISEPTPEPVSSEALGAILSNAIGSRASAEWLVLMEPDPQKITNEWIEDFVPRFLSMENIRNRINQANEQAFQEGMRRITEEYEALREHAPDLNDAISEYREGKVLLTRIIAETESTANLDLDERSSKFAEIYARFEEIYHRLNPEDTEVEEALQLLEVERRKIVFEENQSQHADRFARILTRLKEEREKNRQANKLLRLGLDQSWERLESDAQREMEEAQDKVDELEAEYETLNDEMNTLLANHLIDVGEIDSSEVSAMIKEAFRRIIQIEEALDKRSRSFEESVETSEERSSEDGTAQQNYDAELQRQKKFLQEYLDLLRDVYYINELEGIINALSDDDIRKNDIQEMLSEFNVEEIKGTLQDHLLDEQGRLLPWATNPINNSQLNELEKIELFRFLHSLRQSEATLAIEEPDDEDELDIPKLQATIEEAKSLVHATSKEIEKRITPAQSTMRENTIEGRRLNGEIENLTRRLAQLSQRGESDAIEQLRQQLAQRKQQTQLLLELTQLKRQLHNTEDGAAAINDLAEQVKIKDKELKEIVNNNPGSRYRSRETRSSAIQRPIVNELDTLQQIEVLDELFPDLIEHRDELEDLRSENPQLDASDILDDLLEKLSEEQQVLFDEEMQQPTGELPAWENKLDNRKQNLSQAEQQSTLREWLKTTRNLITPYVLTHNDLADRWIEINDHLKNISSTVLLPDNLNIQRFGTHQIHERLMRDITSKLQNGTIALQPAFHGQQFTNALVIGTNQNDHSWFIADFTDGNLTVHRLPGHIATLETQPAFGQPLNLTVVGSDAELRDDLIRRLRILEQQADRNQRRLSTVTAVLGATHEGLSLTTSLITNQAVMLQQLQQLQQHAQNLDSNLAILQPANGLVRQNEEATQALNIERILDTLEEVARSQLQNNLQDRVSNDANIFNNWMRNMNFVVTNSSQLPNENLQVQDALAQARQAMQVLNEAMRDLNPDNQLPIPRIRELEEAFNTHRTNVARVFINANTLVITEYTPLAIQRLTALNTESEIAISQLQGIEIIRNEGEEPEQIDARLRNANRTITELQQNLNQLSNIQPAQRLNNLVNLTTRANDIEREIRNDIRMATQQLQTNVLEHFNQIITTITDQQERVSRPAMPFSDEEAQFDEAIRQEQFEDNPDLEEDQRLPIPELFEVRRILSEAREALKHTENQMPAADTTLPIRQLRQLENDNLIHEANFNEMMAQNGIMARIDALERQEEARTSEILERQEIKLALEQERIQLDTQIDHLDDTLLDQTIQTQIGEIFAHQRHQLDRLLYELMKLPNLPQNEARSRVTELQDFIKQDQREQRRQNPFRIVQTRIEQDRINLDLELREHQVGRIRASLNTRQAEIEREKSELEVRTVERRRQHHLAGQLRNVPTEFHEALNTPLAQMVIQQRFPRHNNYAVVENTHRVAGIPFYQANGITLFHQEGDRRIPVVLVIPDHQLAGRKLTLGQFTSFSAGMPPPKTERGHGLGSP